MLRIGLVGLGNQGNEYLLAQHECDALRIVAGCDRSPEMRRHVAERWPQIELTSSLDEMGKLELDGLILALPHHIYQGIWNQLLEIHLPILKEKPLGRNLLEARQFVATASIHGCALQTAVQRREHPSYLFLRDLLQGKKISDIHLSLHLGFERPEDEQKPTWRDNLSESGGGALLDCGYHMVDLAHFFIGQFDLLSSTLYHNHKLWEPNQVDDAMHLIGRKSSTWVYIDSKRFRDSDGRFPKSELVVVYTDAGVFSANREGVWKGLPQEGEQMYICKRDWELAMVSQMDDFAQRVKNKSFTPVQFWDQLPAQKIIEQAYQASSNWYGEHDARD